MKPLENSLLKISNDDRKKFEKFVADAPYAIEQLRKAVNHEAGRLDYSPESLDWLEDWLITQKHKRKYIFFRKLPEKDVWYIVRLGYYFGEVLIRNTHGHWELDEEKGSANFGIAVIKGYQYDVAANPLSLAYNFWIKEERGMFRRSYDYFKKLMSEQQQNK